MNIGDRVRVLHGTEEGIITKIIDSKTAEMEIEDGFSFPILISEVVLVESKEDKYFSGEISVESSEKKKEIQADKGVFLALELGDKSDKYFLHIINNTDHDLVCTIFRKEGKLKYGGLFRGLIKSRTATQFAEFASNSLSTYNDLYCQYLIFKTKSGPLNLPIERHLKIAQLLAGTEAKSAPVIEKEAWTKQLDDQNVEVPAPTFESKRDDDDLPHTEVDLHADVLGIDEANHSPNEILEAQLRVFNDRLDKAIMYNLPEITFIHGVGQGTLKKQIIQEIRKRKEIKFWEDAQKEKFGYGATKIVL